MTLLVRWSCLCALAIIMAGCEKSVSTDALVTPEYSPGAAEKASIALVMKTLTNPFFVEMEKGARRAEAEFDIDLVVKTAAQETSIQQQVTIVEGLIRDEIDAIVIAPGDSVELIPVLKRAQDAGIKVINIDNQIDPEFAQKNNLTPIPFISVDNESSAYLSAKYVADKITQPTQAAIMEGIRGALNAELRKQGAVRAFEENPHINIVVSESANWKIDEGRAVMQKWLTQYSDIGVIFVANDMMALGVIHALEEANRTDVLVASYDALEQAKAAIKAGGLQATMDQLPSEQGYQGVVYAIKALKREPLPELTLVETKLITRETLTQ